ncbi:MAG: hypothetical protein FWC73_14365 [Defluviitaleaceae bacterium]|nr:hypothetical protein [Defluviitaleaceae bacterium]
MSFCTQCGKLLQEGQACECTAATVFCTQCGKSLAEGHTCECTKPPVDVEPTTVAEPLPVTIAPQPKTVKVTIEAETPPSEPPPPEVIEYPPADTPVSEADFDYPKAKPQNISVEKPLNTKAIRHYHITHLRNILRINRAAGYLEVTSKRISFKAEHNFLGKKTIVHREHGIDAIAGIEAVSNYRFSLARALIGLVTLAGVAMLIAAGVLMLTFGFMQADADVVTMVRPTLARFLPQVLEGLMEGWYPDINSVSLIVGLAIGFGGIALFLLFKGKQWPKLVLLGASLGGFGAAALTYNLFAFVLLVMAIAFTVFGLSLFAWIPDLVISVINKEGVFIPLVCGRRFMDAICGTKGIGYAEAAPTEETEEAIKALGASLRSK